jgi:release factor glutamine methyltransferase
LEFGAYLGFACLPVGREFVIWYFKRYALCQWVIVWVIVKMTLLEILNWSTQYLKDNQIENPRLNAELLLAHSMNLSRETLYIHLNSRLREEEKERLEKLIQRRISGEPLQYILGHQEFWSIDFKVDPRVLIPRPETELLVEQGLSILSKTLSKKKNVLVLEIGTGSGAIAISLAKESKALFILATDISRDALLLAKKNAENAGVSSQIQFVNGDLFYPFRSLRGRGPFDLVLSNPPYINRSEIRALAKEVKDHEPIIALDGGEDGLEFYRIITQQAHFYLRDGGWLLLEVGKDQGGKVSEMIENEGYFRGVQLIRDISGIERVVKAQRNNPPIFPFGFESHRL